MDFTKYPNREYQLDWIRFYLECKSELNGQSTSDVTDTDVEDFYVNTNKIALVSLAQVAYLISLIPIFPLKAWNLCKKYFVKKSHFNM